MPDKDSPSLDSIEMLKLLYTWYKEEVFRRREQMIWLTAAASSILVIVLFIVPGLPPPRPTHRAPGFLAAGGATLFAGIMAYLIRQQQNRHRLAKQVLVRIEQALGLYEEGRYGAGTLYPEAWRSAWLRDRSATAYLAGLAALTVLVVAAVLLR